MKLCDGFEVQPIWFDSLGAKSSCTLVKTSDLIICIDPGMAVMQPSYPLSWPLKHLYAFKAKAEISKAAEQADLIVTSHYHYDHHTRETGIYKGKELWIKDPNRWINKSQWDRARDWLELQAKARGEKLEETEPQQEKFPDPYKELKLAQKKDFGDYQERREELLEKWRGRFRKLCKHWKSHQWIKEPSFASYADGKQIKRDETTIKFHGPLFHGIEYAATGWVFSTVIKFKNKKFIHSSDLQGPTLEDYAQWLCNEKPDFLCLDGPASYLLGYMLNRINLQRSIDNAAKIAKKAGTLLWDHHLLREKRYKERTSKVWENDNVTTAAELLGKKPLIERCTEWSIKEIKQKERKAEERLNG